VEVDGSCLWNFSRSSVKRLSPIGVAATDGAEVWAGDEGGQGTRCRTIYFKFAKATKLVQG